MDRRYQPTTSVERVESSGNVAVTACSLPGACIADEDRAGERRGRAEQLRPRVHSHEELAGSFLSKATNGVINRPALRHTGRQSHAVTQEPVDESRTHRRSWPDPE